MDAIEAFEIAARSVSTVVVRSARGDLERVTGEMLSSLGVRRIVSDCSSLKLPSFERGDAAAADAGVSEAEWGVASTGSLVLPMDPPRRRATSLVPPISVVILNAARILPDLPSTLNHIGETYMTPPARPSSVVLITGPSRTADIELNLVMGVHGPRKLIVVLVT
jgi:L-lactate dehydrogenase complex protein LldG